MASEHIQPTEAGHRNAPSALRCRASRKAGHRTHHRDRHALGGSARQDLSEFGFILGGKYLVGVSRISGGVGDVHDSSSLYAGLLYAGLVRTDTNPDSRIRDALSHGAPPHGLPLLGTHAPGRAPDHVPASRKSRSQTSQVAPRYHAQPRPPAMAS